MAYDQKIKLFLIYVFDQIKSEKIFFCDILDRKEYFLEQKREVWKSAKKSTISNF